MADADELAAVYAAGVRKLLLLAGEDAHDAHAHAAELFDLGGGVGDAGLALIVLLAALGVGDLFDVVRAAVGEGYQYPPLVGAGGEEVVRGAQGQAVAVEARGGVFKNGLVFLGLVVIAVDARDGAAADAAKGHDAHRQAAAREALGEDIGLGGHLLLALELAGGAVEQQVDGEFGVRHALVLFEDASVVQIDAAPYPGGVELARAGFYHRVVEVDEDAVAHLLRQADDGQAVGDDAVVIIFPVGLGLAARGLALEPDFGVARLGGEFAAREVEHTARVPVAAEAVFDIRDVAAAVHGLAEAVGDIAAQLLGRPVAGEAADGAELAGLALYLLRAHARAEEVPPAAYAAHELRQLRKRVVPEHAAGDAEIVLEYAAHSLAELLARELGRELQRLEQLFLPGREPVPLAQHAAVVLELYAVGHGQVEVVEVRGLGGDRARIALTQQSQGRPLRYRALIGAVFKPRPEEVLPGFALGGVLHAVEQLLYRGIVVVFIHRADDAVHIHVGIALRIVGPALGVEAVVPGGVPDEVGGAALLPLLLDLAELLMSPSQGAHLSRRGRRGPGRRGCARL